MSRQQTDYYALLGIGRGASAADVDRAYRRAARATHPDVHPGDASAAERFRAVAIAYETLSDPARRAAYDRTRPAVARTAPARIAVDRRQAAAVPPVQIGRRRPQPDPPWPFRARPVDTAAADDLLELAQALARAVLGRRLP